MSMSIKDHARAALFGSAVYRLTLLGGTPAVIQNALPDPWPGNPILGEGIVAGRFPILGREVAFSGDLWAALPTSLGAQAEMHGFGWLRHLRAAASGEASAKARTLILAWIERFGDWHAVAWRAGVLGDRLAHWLANHAFLGALEDTVFRERLLAAAARQARHLRRVADTTGRVPDSFAAARGLIASGACLDGFEKNFDAGLSLLNRAIDAQILPDGGHVARCPSRQLAVLADLIDARAMLTAAHIETPPPLQVAIDRMAPMLRSLRHGDGRLALFNGGNEGDEAEIERVLAESGVRGRPLMSAPHAGFQRLSAGRTMVLVDAGAPPQGATAHAAPLSFEMSVGSHRLIVNLGAHPDENSEWHQVLRATAAHSTVVVDDTNAIELPKAGTKALAPVLVTCQRQESDGNVVLQMRHQGYARPFGLVHRRDLYLSAHGDDVRGQDTLAGSGGKAFAARFHLHPDVKASLVEGGAAVLLKLAGGDGWRFLASGGRIGLEESVYHGDIARIRRSQQIVVAGPLAGAGAIIKWAFRREMIKDRPQPETR